jgi:hypothetical protein
MVRRREGDGVGGLVLRLRSTARKHKLECGPALFEGKLQRRANGNQATKSECEGNQPLIFQPISE